MRRLSVPALMGCEVGSDSQARDGNGAHSSFTERTRLVAAHLQVPPVTSGAFWAPLRTRAETKCKCDVAARPALQRFAAQHAALRVCHCKP